MSTLFGQPASSAPLCGCSRPPLLHTASDFGCVPGPSELESHLEDDRMVPQCRAAE